MTMPKQFAGGMGSSPVGTLPFSGEDDMGRRKLQLKGDLYKQGGWWKLRWKEDQVDAEGKTKPGWSRPVWLGPSEGRGSFTKKQAQRIAWENHLSRLDRNMRAPNSIASVREFVERYFVPEHVAMLKPGGRAHYSTHLIIILDGVPEVKKRSRKKDAPEFRRLFGIGEMRLRDVTGEDCQRLVSGALERGYSVQYAIHVRNAVSAIFDHAESKNWFSGSNPVRHVNLPENVPASQSALTFDELRTVAGALDTTTRAMVLCASLTSMNVAEMLGLKWKYVNLTSEWTVADGESLPPLTIAVRSQWTLGQIGTVKAKKRRRLIPISDMLRPHLAALRNRKDFMGKEDFLFTVSGKPVDSCNLLRRRLAPLGKRLGLKLGWHTFRRTFDTLADQIGMSLGERQAVMGHSDAAMTQRYVKTPSEQARTAMNLIGERLGEIPN